MNRENSRIPWKQIPICGHQSLWKKRMRLGKIENYFSAVSIVENIYLRITRVIINYIRPFRVSFGPVRSIEIFSYVVVSRSAIGESEGRSFLVC